jgi:hypothetical protein
MPYALITALIFALVAIAHGWRIFKGWTVQIGPTFRLHDCFVGRPCRCCAARDLGVFAERLARVAPSALKSARCPLWVNNGHGSFNLRCPVYTQ